MITGIQIRAARAALKWKAKDLAERSGVSWATIQRMETHDNVPSGLAHNIQKIQQAFEVAGVEFLPDNGVRLKS